MILKKPKFNHTLIYEKMKEALDKILLKEEWDEDLQKKFKKFVRRLSFIEALMMMLARDVTGHLDYVSGNFVIMYLFKHYGIFGLAFGKLIILEIIFKTTVGLDNRTRKLLYYILVLSMVANAITNVVSFGIIGTFLQAVWIYKKVVAFL